MIFILAFKEIIKNKWRSLTNMIVVTLFFAIVMCLVNIALQMHEQLQRVPDYGVTFTYLGDEEDIDGTEIFGDTEIVYNHSTITFNEQKEIADCLFTYSLYYIPNQHNEIYLSQVLADKLGLVDDQMASIKVKFLINEYTINLKVQVLDYLVTDSTFYFSINYLSNFNETVYPCRVMIRDYEQLEYAYQMSANEETIDSEKVEALFLYFESVQTIIPFLYTISLISLVLSCILLYNLMDIFVAKRERFIGILKNEGASSNDIFWMYVVIIEIISFLALFFSSGIALGINYYIANLSKDLLNQEIIVEYLWYTPVGVFVGFNVIFVIFFFILYKRIMKMDTALIIRGNN